MACLIDVFITTHNDIIVACDMMYSTSSTLLILQGNVYLMVIAGQILTSLLVNKLVSNDLITCVTNCI